MSHLSTDFGKGIYGSYLIYLNMIILYSLDYQILCIHIVHLLIFTISYSQNNNYDNAIHIMALTYMNVLLKCSYAL